jgi:hypothetical protein
VFHANASTPVNVAGYDLLRPVLRGLLFSDVFMRFVPGSFLRGSGEGRPASWSPCLSPTVEAANPSALRAQLLTFEDIAPGRDTTLLAAAVASARFPIVTPAATLPCPEPYWRVVDGGYFENSGLTTVLELLEHMVRAASAATGAEQD